MATGLYQENAKAARRRKSSMPMAEIWAEENLSSGAVLRISLPVA
jgi:hypothetical protein